MVDRITTIEEQLRAVLLSIDASIVKEYQYLNDVKSVYFEEADQVVSITKTINSGYPNIIIRMNPDEDILEGEAQAYQNRISYKLVCEVKMEKPESNPKQALKTKMNTLLQDVKFAISNNYHLNGTCDEATLNRSNRSYNDDGNTLRSGNLMIELDIEYTQSRHNPAINVCA